MPFYANLLLRLFWMTDERGRPVRTGLSFEETSEFEQLLALKWKVDLGCPSAPSSYDPERLKELRMRHHLSVRAQMEAQIEMPADGRYPQ